MGYRSFPHTRLEKKLRSVAIENRQTARGKACEKCMENGRANDGRNLARLAVSNKALHHLPADEKKHTAEPHAIPAAVISRQNADVEIAAKLLTWREYPGPWYNAVQPHRETV